MADIGNNDRIQLKQEELVGNEVVLTDINPKTNSRSVDDATTGTTLDKTIERMWQSINNKLSRIVNSVNGRTGVVVLSAEDVGLDKVDNVSLGDIKQWVINRMTTEFGHKRLILFDRLEQVTEYISDNDKSHRDKPFYSHHGFNGDERAYIGYTEWDDGNQSLIEHHMVIDTIGFTDNSLIYSENIEGKMNFAGGGLGVNIYTYEDALELYNAAATNKGESGLRINKSKIVPKLYFFEGVYGDGSEDDDSAFLYFKQPPTTDTPIIDIYLDGWQVDKNGFYLRMNDVNTTDGYKFKIGDMILCMFKGYSVWTPDEGQESVAADRQKGNYVTPTGMTTALCKHGWAVGCITKAPDKTNPGIHYQVNFYTLGNIDGYSTQTKRVPLIFGKDIESDNLNATELKFAHGPIPDGYGKYEYSGGVNLTPLNAIGDVELSTSTSKTPSYTYITLPQGRVRMNFDRNSKKSNVHGGLIFNTDMSLCVQPRYATTNSPNKLDRSLYAENWSSVYSTVPYGASAGTIVPADSYDNNNDTLSGAGTESLLGVNLQKSVYRVDDTTSFITKFYFDNLSGLRINYSGQQIFKPFLGWRDDDGHPDTYTYGDDTIDRFGWQGCQTSGGLSVNVGDFLDIGDAKNNGGDEVVGENNAYYTHGKVNVRVGNGIGDDGKNRLSVKLRGNATGFDANGCVNVHVAFYTTGAEYQMGTILYIPTTASVDGETKDVTLVGTVLQSFTATTYENDKDKIGKICQIVGKVIAP